MRWHQLWPIDRKQWACGETRLQLDPTTGLAVDLARWKLRLCWDYLRISPSYWQVHRVQTGAARITKAQRQQQHLAPVEQTYAVMGDVYSSSFSDWFAQQGRAAYGLGTRPAPKQLAMWSSVKGLGDTDFQALTCSAQQWQRQKFANLADCAALVLFIPFTRTQEDNLRLIQRALHRHAAKHPYQPVRNSAYTIDYASRHQLLSMWENLALLRFRAMHWQEELWRVGARWHQEDWAAMAVARNLDPASIRKRHPGEGLQRNVVTICVRRRLAHVYWIAENAARGCFPEHSAIANQTAHWQLADGVLAHRLDSLLGKH